MWLVVVALAGSAASARSSPPKVLSKWLHDAQGYEQALRKRKATGKPMVVYFYTDWCPYCARFNKGLLSSRSVRQYLNNVVRVAVNPERGPKEASLAKLFGVRGYPSFFVVRQGTGKAQKVHPFSRKGSRFVPMSPPAFVEACKAAERSPQDVRGEAPSKPRRRLRTPKQSPEQPSPQISSEVEAPSPQADAENPVTLHLVNGRAISGDLVEETPQQVRLRWEYGEVVFDRSEIARVERGQPSPTAP